MKNTFAQLLITGVPINSVPGELKMPVTDEVSGFAMLGDTVGVDQAGNYRFGAIVDINSDGTHVVFEHGIWDALRRDSHIESYYQTVLAQVEMAMSFARTGLEATWFADAGNQFVVQNYQAVVASAESLLKDRTQELLAQACCKLNLGQTMEDVEGRFNPFSRAAIMVAVENRLDAYRRRATKVTGEVSLRHSAILTELERSMTIFELVSRELTEISRWWAPSRVGKRLGQRRTNSMTRRLSVCMALLREVIAHPLRDLAFNTETDLSKMIESLDDDDMGCAAEYLMRALRALQLPTIFAVLYEAITVVSLAERRKGGLNHTEKQLVVYMLNRVLMSLEAIDDTKFERPVAQFMITSITFARDGLKNATHPDLLYVKNALLTASRL